jgi:hypothetical protein
LTLDKSLSKPRELEVSKIVADHLLQIAVDVVDDEGVQNINKA